MNNNVWSHINEMFQLPFTSPVLIFTLILFIILLAPPLMERIRIPYIVGYILAGVIIGPYCLDLLKKNLAVDLFSTIGLLYIMFIAGTELNLVEFKKNSHKSVVFGIFTFFIPIGIGYPVCYYLLGYPPITSLLTSSIFATQTLVAYPIISKYRLADNEAVSIAVGGTILTDTAVLILLAIIIGANSNGLTTEFWLHLIGSLTVFTLIVFLLIPRVAKWYFARPGTNNVTRYVFVLACMFFSATLAQMAGVEPIIGAFISALALNKFIPKPSTLWENIEFVGNAIFIPFFLISVGMIINLKVLFGGIGAFVVAVTLTVVALVGKWIAAFFTQKAYNYSGNQRKLIFGLSSSHAAATLAIILVGYKSKIIDDNILNGTIILILVTCLVASIVTENAGSKIAKKEEPDPVENIV